MTYKPSPVSVTQLREWLAATVAGAYHGLSTHDFEACGDPFCMDAKLYRDQILQLLPVQDGVDSGKYHDGARQLNGADRTRR